MLAQNVSFEKGRIKELSNIFPEYKKELMEIYDKAFDLLWLVNTKSDMYEGLGYSKEEASLFNYYTSDLSGSFSIKKTLPVFSDLSYKDLIALKYQALIDYCCQYTWVMVVILEALRKLVK